MSRMSLYMLFVFFASDVHSSAAIRQASSPTEVIHSHRKRRSSDIKIIRVPLPIKEDDDMGNIGANKKKKRASSLTIKVIDRSRKPFVVTYRRLFYHYYNLYQKKDDD